MSPRLHAVAAIDGARHAVTELIGVNQARTLSGVYVVAVDAAHGRLYVTDHEGLLATNELSGEWRRCCLPRPYLTPLVWNTGRAWKG